ncbi:MAG: hypothetical protein ACW99J_15885, partial [Candidatus Thorarchaeota archaeon]
MRVLQATDEGVFTLIISRHIVKAILHTLYDEEPCIIIHGSYVVVQVPLADLIAHCVALTSWMVRVTTTPAAVVAEML